MQITLPWPDRALSPNARVHWAAKARAVKDARLEASLSLPRLYTVFGDGPVPMRWTFHPPSRRRYDRDNIIASCKAYQDGLSDVLGVDDSRFEPTYRMGEVRGGGCVIVEIGEWLK
jgi:crossover junction endodeoxyribonuclease RusA